MTNSVKVTYKCKCGSANYEVVDWFMSTINSTVENGEIDAENACDHYHDALLKVTINCFDCNETTRLKGIKSRSEFIEKYKVNESKD